MEDRPATYDELIVLLRQVKAHLEKAVEEGTAKDAEIAVLRRALEKCNRSRNAASFMADPENFKEKYTEDWIAQAREGRND